MFLVYSCYFMAKAMPRIAKSCLKNRQNDKTTFLNTPNKKMPPFFYFHFNFNFNSNNSERS